MWVFFSPNLAPTIRRCRSLPILVPPLPAFFCASAGYHHRAHLFAFFIIATWAAYNTVRYFIAFSDFGDPTIEALCLALGTSTGVSLLLIFSSFLLTFRKGFIHGLSYVRTTMDYLSSFCLIGPAVVNFALIFIWKDSDDPHWNVVNRCHFDVDVIWSVSNKLCNNKSPYWAIWLTVSALRLALTLIICVESPNFVFI